MIRDMSLSETKMFFLLFFFDNILKSELVAQGFSWVIIMPDMLIGKLQTEIIIMLDILIGKLQTESRGEFELVRLFLGRLFLLQVLSNNLIQGCHSDFYDENVTPESWWNGLD
ncbi:hypothetical protein Pint_32047 [Pistacia integerrima]|uniref:Uncharacterized protein n=1 Tax=Pistacia integerrima TaxID=434235 RepID=A0ACC0XRY2_9ROSI|nr:hypothetical protein Pint_32047 [Pistacia integerrima]